VRVLWVIWAVLCGCAGGADSPPGPLTGGGGFGPASDPSTPVDEGTLDDDSDDDSASGESSWGPEEGSGEAESTAVADGSSSSTTSETDPSEGSSSDGDDTSPPLDCPTPGSCATAEIIGMVSGDEPSADLVVNGSEPTWLTFRATEDNESFAGEALSVTVTLSSPPSVDFDLYVYRGAADGTTGCNGVLSSSTSAAATDIVQINWGEAAVANGIDDHSWIAVEIVPKAPMCDDGSQWTLEVEGDT